MNATIFPIGATITYDRTTPLTGVVTRETAIVEGRNWTFDAFGSYIVNQGECVYPHQLRA